MEEREARQAPLPTESTSQPPFAWGWYSCNMQDFRPPSPELGSTLGLYWLFPYETLPPLPPLDPNFTHLAPHAPSAGSDTMSPAAREKSRTWLHQRVETLVHEAADLDLHLPESFVRFMKSPELQERFRWGGAYGFWLSTRLVRCPGFDQGYLIAVLRDQQDCMLWCLCVTRDGTQCVLALPMDVVDALPPASSDALYGNDEAGHLPEEADDERETGIVARAAGDAPDEALTELVEAMSWIRICAPSLDDFLYRIWLEDEIGWKQAGLEPEPLTAVEQSYLDHYARTTSP